MQVRDPVCGMRFSEDEAAATVEVDGTTYHFCAEGCRRAFEDDPERYTGDDGADHEEHSRA